MDEVFGEANFLAQVVVNLNPKGRQLGRGFATSHEYLLVVRPRRPPPARSTRAAPRPSTSGDFPLTAPDGRRFRHLPLRNTNKKFNPVTAPTLHFPLYGDPATGRVATTPFDGAPEIDAGLRRRPPGGLAVVGGRGSTSGPTTWCAGVIRGRCGERVDVFQRDWLHREGGRRKKLRTIWLAEEIGSTDTAVAELKALVGHVFESPKPTGLVRRILATMPDDARVLDSFAGSGTTGHAVALAERRGRRHPPLHQHQLRRADPRRAPTPTLAGLATVADITRARLRAVAETVGGGLGRGPAGSRPGIDALQRSATGSAHRPPGSRRQTPAAFSSAVTSSSR